MTDLSHPMFEGVVANAASVLLTAAGGRELLVKVSDIQGIRSSAFSVDGTPLPAARRRFTIQAGETKLLQWVMIGPAGSSMVVKVMDGDTVVESRTPSRIPDGFDSSFDLLQIVG